MALALAGLLAGWYSTSWSAPLFDAPYHLYTTPAPLDVAVADFDQDGRLDLAVGCRPDHPGHDGVAILLGDGDGTFHTGGYIVTGASPLSLAAADLNGDGLPDLAVANTGSGTISVLIGKGDATFEPRADFAAGDQPRSIVVDDLNEDGKPDLVFGNATFVVSVLLGDGTGAFPLRTEFPTQYRVSGIVAGDLNGDGHLDLVAVCGDGSRRTGSTSVLLGKGDGTFRWHRDIDTGYRTSALAIGDVDGDSQPDLVVGTPLQLLILHGNGDGSFTPKGAVEGVGYVGSMKAVDLNRDGFLDLLVLEDMGVSVLLGRGDGTFTAGDDYLAWRGVVGSLALADLDGDGRQDVAMAVNGSNAVAVMTGNGNGTFGPPTFGLDNGGGAVAIADLNGDGRQDVAAVNSWRTVSVLLGNGAGTLGPKLDLPTNIGPHCIASGDFDDDGHPDLAVATNGYLDPASISLLFGKGDGTFAPRTDLPTGAVATHLLARDLNADGKLDLVFSSSPTNGPVVSVLLGLGDGKFAPRMDFPTGRGPGPFAVGDLNGDGWLDLAVTNQLEENISILLGKGDGTFGPKTDLGTRRYAQDVAIGDLNGDGRQDLAVTTEFFNDAALSVFFGDGTGGFLPPADLAIGRGSVNLLDVNGDGRLDVVFMKESSTISVLLGQGGGEFLLGTDCGVNYAAKSFESGDLNGDGSPDLVVTNYNSVIVLLNRGGIVPVLVEALEAAPTESGILLTWKLSSKAPDGLIGVRVQRSEAAAGPYSDRTAPLAPTAVSFEDDDVVSGHDYWYRLMLLSASGSSVLAGPVNARPTGPGGLRTALYQPFEAAGGGPVEIRYSLARARTPVRLGIYDVRGRVVRILAAGNPPAGQNRQSWDRRDVCGSQVPRGVYLIRLHAGNVAATRKLTLAHR